MCSCKKETLNTKFIFCYEYTRFVAVAVVAAASLV